MNHKQMHKRCPASRFLFRGYITDYLFKYDGYSEKREGAVANLWPLVGSKVWGGLYDVTDDDLTALDRFEGVPSGYHRREISVFDEKGITHQAGVYIRDPAEPGNPGSDYKKTLLQGASDCELPQDYILNNL